MPRGKNKTENKEEMIADGDDGIARIGEFVTPKPQDEIPDDVGNEENEVPQDNVEKPTNGGSGSINEIPPDQIRQKFQDVIVQVTSRGLSEEEKTKISDNFLFWNGIAWEILDIGDNLKSTLNNIHIKMSPTKAMLLYLGGTAAMVLALRPDLLKKFLKRKQGAMAEQKMVEPLPEEKIPEEPLATDENQEKKG